ncbi:armadillo-type protein [Rhodofomes roseus]|uniref:U3 small nucleolar RNA-associated protein 10 n=1 Tax=Rhodofomes roseus TaxID=34475 RepID=A0ABQ8KJB4_9APHY|nr:armadillo-type protein [Rhodofomes roseus]KAH9837712.1 armadillo-type protein [Rhodofomes roseus]
MTSSLAAQLAQSASLNAALLNTSRRRSTESYLFSAKEAQQHDLDAIFALGTNGFAQLKSLDSALRHFEQALFSDSAKGTDRTLLPADANAELDRQIASFLPLIGPFLLDAPTGRVLEWLVRRFRINEFNVQDVLTLFLPYHESPHFDKMLSILHIDDNSMFRFLQAYKTTSKPLPRSGLDSEMRKHSDLARFITNLLPNTLKNGGAGTHKALVIFHTGVLLDFIAKSQVLDEGTTAFLLAASLEVLQIEPSEAGKANGSLLQEAGLSSLLVLAALSNKCYLTQKALKTILNAVATCAERISAKQLVRTLACLCAPQDESEKLPRALLSAALKKADIDTELRESLVYVGSEKLIHPWIRALVAKLEKERYYEALTSLLSYASLPEVITRHTTSALLQKVIAAEDPSAADALNARRALSVLQLHHSRIVEAVCREAVKEEDTREAVEQIVLALAMAVPGHLKASKADTDMIVASMNADANVRALAVKELCDKLANEATAAAEKDAAKDALRTRILDTTPSVIEALYSRHTELLPVLLEDPSTYISSLAFSLHAPKASPSRALMRLHLSFLATHFYPALRAQDPALAERVVFDLFFPCLVTSKPRQKTANMAWEILEGSEGENGIARYELLGGCVDAVRWQQQQLGGKAGEEVREDEGYKGMERLARVDLALSAKMADNILASNNYSHLFGLLMWKLQDPNPHARSLAYLTARALLSRLSGEHQIDAAHAIIRATGLESLEGMGEFMRTVTDLTAFLHDMSVASAVVLKPSSQSTLQRLQISILAMMPVIARPAGVHLDWLTTPSEAPVDMHGNDTRGIRYIQLLRAVYILSNSSAALPALSLHLLRALFVNLGDESLGFLAGIWLSPSLPAKGRDADYLRTAALHHAAAFLEAHHATQHWLDFQTVLPAVLVAVQNPDRRIREAAVACLQVLVKLVEKEPSGIYAYDAIYGPPSKLLQYTEWADFGKYVAALGSVSEHMMHDPAYVREFHKEHLSVAKGDGKKVAGYKQRIVFYLLSHVNACPMPNVKLAILRSLETTSSGSKCQALQPTLEHLSEVVPPSLEVVDKDTEDIFVLATSSFDASAVAELNESTKTTWSVFEQCLRTCLLNRGLKVARAAIIRNVQQVVRSRLSVDRQEQLCQFLLDIAIQSSTAMADCKLLLDSVLSDVSLIIRLLVLLQPVVIDAAERAQKRARMDPAAARDSDIKGQSLTLLVEVLGAKSLPGSMELVASLLETLTRVVHDTSAVPADRTYLEQLLMNALESSVANMPANIQAGSIRVDILTELIRAVDNPQTFHQALLLIAAMARLAPDAILHNVMPVFTFMGSNVFHRDDSYSFRVVQKTIDSIVPVMVASLRSDHALGLDLYLASRDFLRIFTDASNHIPRHRRVNFYSHLVDVLGPDDFLAPVCMLLVDKVSKRVVRQDTSDSRTSLALPIATFQSCSMKRQIELLVETALEAERLVNRGFINASEPCFMAYPTDDEESLRTASTQRALALLVYCTHAVEELVAALSGKSRSSEGLMSSELLSVLLRISVVADAQDDGKEVAQAARRAMAGTLKAMAAAEFMSGVLKMLHSADWKVQLGVLDVLKDRVGDIADQTRRDLAQTVKDIVETIRSIISGEPEEALAVVSLQSLGSITSTAEPGELNSLATIVPLILARVHAEATSSAALGVLSPMCSKLGPRIIPHLKSIVRECTKVLGSNATSTDDSSPIMGASSVLQTLLSAVPTFWGEKEILLVTDTYLRTCEDASHLETSYLTPIIKTMTKRLPSKLLLPTLSKLWSSTSDLNGPTFIESRYAGFFTLLKRSLRAAERPVVLEHIRTLFTTFQTAFELITDTNRSEIEHAVITSFLELVVKLNETAFRPLFRKLSDWAFTDEGSGHVRGVTFCHTYSALLDYFKTLMVPYMTFTWIPFLKLLDEHYKNPAQNPDLWTSILTVVSKTLASDEGAFWREDKIRQLVTALVKQIPVCVQLRSPEGRKALLDCLVATMEVVNDDDLLKTMNIDILMHTRSEEASLRLFSVSCSTSLWKAHGGKLLGLVAETATFITECAEDDNDSVVREAHNLKDAVESVAGKIDV